MTEELPDPGLRIITIVVKPGVDPEVSYDDFAYWEAKAALLEALRIVEDESELSYGIAFTPGQPDDEDEDGDQSL